MVTAVVDNIAAEPVAAVGSNGLLEIAGSTGLFVAENWHSNLLEQQSRQDVHIARQQGVLALGNMAS